MRCLANLAGAWGRACIFKENIHAFSRNQTFGRKALDADGLPLSELARKEAQTSAGLVLTVLAIK